MPDYVKLAHVTADVAAGAVDRTALLVSVTAKETFVVNLKGRWLTATEVADHLDGKIDGETVSR